MGRRNKSGDDRWGDDSARVNHYDRWYYFPSYEVITSPLGRGIFYEPNMRSVSQMGVDVAMATFFAEHDRQSGPDHRAGTPAAAQAGPEKSADEVVCEEVLLDAFSR